METKNYKRERRMQRRKKGYVVTAVDIVSDLVLLIMPVIIAICVTMIYSTLNNYDLSDYIKNHSDPVVEENMKWYEFFGY